MKTLFLTTLASLTITHSALAQEPVPHVALSFGAVNKCRFHSKSSRLADYYALGSKVDLVINNTWLVGFSQTSSVTPENLLRTSLPSQRDTRLSEYALTAGNKWHFTPQAYTLVSIQGGIGRLSQRGGVAAEQPAGTHASFFTAGAEAGLGYRLSKHVALEAGTSYQRYFGNDPLPVAAKELNNLGAQLSLVGTFGLTKQPK